MSDYPAFGKIPRLHRSVTITEKIDGTNGLISIEPLPDGTEFFFNTTYAIDPATGSGHLIKAGSRNRWLRAEKGEDNFGFAAWVQEHASALIELLGPGHHYGEWWGSGIQRGYGLQNGEKRFSLFNTDRWETADLSAVPGLGVVPVLRRTTGDRLSYALSDALAELEELGSYAAPDFGRPEGVVVYHHASRHLYKVTLEKDEEPKGRAA